MRLKSVTTAPSPSLSDAGEVEMGEIYCNEAGKEREMGHERGMERVGKVREGKGGMGWGYMRVTM